jgi:hypothetical protein
MDLSPPKIDGAILAARHSFMPNRLGYCGPDANEVLLDACISNKPSKELIKALQGFQAAYPYLRFIANSMGADDPFDYRAVEAYWIGNDALEKISPGEFYEHLRERFTAKFPKEHVKKFFTAHPYAAFPHHALHVFNAFSAMGTVPDSFANAAGPDDKVGALMDKCRISWGKILEADDKGNWIVEYEPVRRSEGRLSLREPIKTKVIAEVQGRSFISGAKPGDWISFHWGFACTTLSQAQVANLRKYTLSDMTLANTVPVPQ